MILNIGIKKKKKKGKVMNTLTVINCISQTGLFEVLAIKAKYNYILLRIQLQSSRIAAKSFAASVTDVSQL